jgi:hypothetical protein
MKFEILEPFTFEDGVVRMAWVTWLVPADPTQERRCVGVRKYVGELPAGGRCRAPRGARSPV